MIGGCARRANPNNDALPTAVSSTSTTNITADIGSTVTVPGALAAICQPHLVRDTVRMTASEVSWHEVADQLTPSRNYWLTTIGSDGAPHAAPVWGVVVDEVLYLYSETSTVKARNLAADPRLVLHLESGEHVVIIHGIAENLGVPGTRMTVVNALDEKYRAPEDAIYLPSADDAFDVLYAVRPHKAMLWELSDYSASQRRWADRSQRAATRG